MPGYTHLSRTALRPLLLVVLLALPACGSSATSVTSPTTVARCPVTAQAVDAQIPAQGGAGTVRVSTTRDCTWTASTEGPWLSIKAGTSGQGDGTVEFAAAANPDPASRKGAVILNTQRAEITQEAAACDFSLAAHAASFGQAGGSGEVTVRASSGMCAWSAAADAEWIAIRTATGQGSAVLRYEVAPVTGPPRSATITVAGQRFSVSQAEGCAFAIAPTSQSVQSAGGSGTMTIATAPGCPWTASSNAAWITLAPAAGTGPASVAFSVPPTSGPARTGTAVVAGQTFTVTQSPGCAFTISPESASVPAGGGTGRVSVATAAGCAWAASSSAPWLTIASGASGSGNGDVHYAAAATTGPGRAAAMTIAGQTFTVTQGQGCTFALSATGASIADAGGQGSFQVETSAGCGWTVSAAVPWITITSGTGGTGIGTVQFTVAANSGPARSGAISAAGGTFTVTQGGGCSYALSPASQTVPGGGGTGTVNVSAGSGCGWSATSNAAWLSITSGEKGSGNGSVAFTAAAHSGPARSGTLTVAGQTFTVQQAESCASIITPEQASVDGAGGTLHVTVSSPAGCAWAALSNDPWITVASGEHGSGDGTVQLVVAANAGAARSATPTIAGHPFTVHQGSGCSFAVAPDRAVAPAAGGAVRIDVTAAASCAWTAASQAAWLSVVSGSSGSGTGSVELSVAAQSGPSRSGVVTVAGTPVTVTQESGCTFALSAAAQPMPAAGGPGMVTVTTAEGCPWTAESQVAWMTVTGEGSRSGEGTVQFTVAANTSGEARSGTILIAGLTFAVNQD